MMPILIGAGLAIILAVVYVAFSMSRFRESAGAMEQTARELLTRLQSVEARLGETEDTLAKNLTAMRREQNEMAAAGRAEQARNFAVLGDAQVKRVMEIGSVQRDSFQNFAKQLAALGEAQAARIKEISESQTESLAAFSNQLANISRLNEDKLEAMRSTVEEKLREMQKGNEEKLEKMRATVDEQLHATLEKRLGEAFASVSERLEQVHKGLGEMRALTSDVGDLKKVLSNVKARGTWGEMQLRALLEQMLTKEQYAENVETRPGSGQRVEFAVVLPGRGEGGATVYLPIDSKFPMEDYQRITAASERGDAAALTEAQKALPRPRARRGEGDTRQIHRAAAYDRLRHTLLTNRRALRRGAAPRRPLRAHIARVPRRPRRADDDMRALEQPADGLPHARDREAFERSLGAARQGKDGV